MPLLSTPYAARRTNNGHRLTETLPFTIYDHSGIPHVVSHLLLTNALRSLRSLRLIDMRRVTETFSFTIYDHSGIPHVVSHLRLIIYKIRLENYVHPRLIDMRRVTEIFLEYDGICPPLHI